MFAFGTISNEVKAGIYTYILVYVAFTRSYSVGAFFLASFFFFFSLLRKKKKTGGAAGSVTGAF